MDDAQIYTRVRDHYSSAAKASEDSGYAQRVAAAFGYTADELASIPTDANLGLSCGNPLALARVREVRSTLSSHLLGEKGFGGVWLMDLCAVLPCRAKRLLILGVEPGLMRFLLQRALGRRGGCLGLT